VYNVNLDTNKHSELFVIQYLIAFYKTKSWCDLFRNRITIKEFLFTLTCTRCNS